MQATAALVIVTRLRDPCNGVVAVGKQPSYKRPAIGKEKRSYPCKRVCKHEKKCGHAGKHVLFSAAGGCRGRSKWL